VADARRILLLVEQQGNRRLLSEWLSTDATLEVVDGDPDDADLVLVDGPALAHARPLLESARRRAAPVFVPCLFVLPHRQAGLVTPDVWRVVDDVVTTPIRTDELRARIERLLATRELSLQSAAEAEELRRSNVDLEQYAFVAAHELMTPVAIVSGVVATVQARYRDGLPAQALELIDMAWDHCAQMRTLVDDVLSYSRLNGPVQRSDVDLHALVTEVADALTPGYRDAGAEIVVGSLPTVAGDETQLRLVVRNLIANALKFRRDEEPLRVEVDGRRVDGHWRISVADNGRGVGDADARTIFDLFERGSRPDGVTGSGIGLAICRRIVEQHGGRIWCERREPAGTVFRFELPAE
jgi:light-regulated signal transduction histidine kinase (bacteriophytochrome)